MKTRMSTLIYRRALLWASALLTLAATVPGALAATTNVAPTAAIISCAMRPGTTLMDVTYKITDPDDATVKVRALAFKDGTRSFANVIRPVTWMEGSQTNLGDAITTGVNHTLTWDVRADWNIDLANVKFEVLCRDNRGLLPLNWITIPATTNSAAVTISSDVPTTAQVLDAFFWLYVDGDTNLVVENGNLKMIEQNMSSYVLVKGASPSYSSVGFLYMRMNLSPATRIEKNIAITARSGISDQFSLLAASRQWNGIDSTAVASEVINTRWVKNTYIGGSITMNDRFTGLMWFFDAGAYGSMGWGTAISYCANLVYAGYADWMLPDVSPLSDISNQKAFFNGVHSGNQVYWSSRITPYEPTAPPPNPNCYFVEMTYGSARLPDAGFDFDGYAGYAWPVR